MKFKIIKYLLLITIGAAGAYALPLILNGEEKVIKGAIAKSTINLPDPKEANPVHDVELVKEDVILKEMKTNIQVVSADIPYSDTFTYKDHVAKRGYGWLEKLGIISKTSPLTERTFKVTINGVVKTGFSFKNMDDDDILIKGDTVYISLPKPEIIAFIANYDEANIEASVGGVAAEFTIEDGQKVFGFARKDAKAEIMNNEKFLQEAEEYNKKAMEEIQRKLLAKFPNIKIKFI